MRLPKRGLMIGSIFILISGILPIGYAAWTQQVDVSVERIPYKIAKLKISGPIKMSNIWDIDSSSIFTLRGTTQSGSEDVTENQEEGNIQEEEEKQGSDTVETVIIREENSQIGQLVVEESETEGETIESEKTTKEEGNIQGEEEKQGSDTGETGIISEENSQIGQSVEEESETEGETIESETIVEQTTETSDTVETGVNENQQSSDEEGGSKN